LTRLTDFCPLNRKHTGERPFQCHCSRRFSRLDNLRQHAQTVHVNEDIPIDSLAATGSRFQRQIRTDRVRQAGNRARASTGGSAGGPQRGHSKSLSTSSINSISSVGSNYSSLDARRRPPPLVMANPQGRPGEGAYSYRPSSPADYSTPTSSTFSTGQTSPRWATGVMSPASSHTRSHSMYTAGARTPGRRLSVPSAPNPFQSGVFHNPPGRPLFGGAGPLNSSHNVAFAPPSAGMVVSPTSSTAGWSSRRDSTTSSAAEDAWRRRTWHPDSQNFNGTSPSQLNNVVSQSAMGPNPPPPIANPSNNRPGLQLPGIESFDNPAQTRPMTPPGRQPSPMRIDSQQPPSLHQTLTPQHHERRNLNVYDASLQRGLTRLEINQSTPPRDGAHKWAMEVNSAMNLAQGEHPRGSVPSVRFEGQQPPTSYPPGPAPHTSLHQQTLSAPPVSTSREGKRRGWYNGPVTVHREEGLRAQPDPRVAHVDRMVHPNFNEFSGFPAREQGPPSNQQPQQAKQEHRPARNESFGPLDALVAVATSEGSTAAAY
jgi:C2H2 transcription facotor